MSYVFLIFVVQLLAQLLQSQRIIFSNAESNKLRSSFRLNKVLKFAVFAPIIVLLVILVLKVTYFDSKFGLRLNHAWLTSQFWVFSAIFYYCTMLIWKTQKEMVLTPFFGLLFSTIIAIYLTPLFNFEHSFGQMNAKIPTMTGIIMFLVSLYIRKSILSSSKNKEKTSPQL